jgi:hypothetical protein
MKAGKYMLQFFIFLAVVTVIAAIVTFAARLGRRKKCPVFMTWWKTEGFPIFIGVWLTFVIGFLVANLIL